MMIKLSARHACPVIALLLATTMSAGVAPAASKNIPRPTRASEGGVPTYNIQAACRDMASVPEARIFDSGGPDATKRCVEDESRARAQLLEEWTQFKAADRAMCKGASSSGTADPTYTELITCLQMTRENQGSETMGARRGAEPPRSAAAEAPATSPPVIARAPAVEQATSQSTGTAQQTPTEASALTPAPSTEMAVDADTQVAELNQTIENLRSELASSEGRIANLEKDKEDAERAAAQAEQVRRDSESARPRIDRASATEKIQPDAKNHRLAILASAGVAGLVILLPITVSVLRRRSPRKRPT